jgi:Holliday junction resolvase-like predicted endonuclease
VEVRIYYECYEQATQFVPVIDLPEQYKITYIRKAGQRKKQTGYSRKYSNECNKILSIKDPDLLISCIKNNIEFPIFVVEFSTAVFTKDHELQRADNLVACNKANCFFVKVSPTKKISVTAGKNFGGDIKFSYLEPYALLLQKKNDLAFHINWEVDSEDASMLKKDPKYMSIPDNLGSWKNIFLTVTKYLGSLEKLDFDWKHSYIEQLTDLEINSWKSDLSKHQIRENPKEFKSSRTKWVKDCNLFRKSYLEINFRMGHAMDPSRGMMTYYSFFHLSRDSVLSKFKIDLNKKTWYASTSQEKNITNLINQSESFSKEDALNCFILGLNLPNGNELLRLIKTKNSEVIDISNYIKNNYKLLNNSIKTLMRFSFGTKLEHENFNIYIVYGPLYEDDHKTGVDITEIQKTNHLSEDIISYAFIHNTNFFDDKILSAVSYPGAQSDIMILPDPELGKAQRRIAIDIIAYDDNYLYLCEVKDQISKIKSDKLKLEKFIKDEKFSNAAKKFTKRYRLGNKELKLCLSFAVNTSEKFFEWINNTDLENIDSICAFLTDERKHIIWNKGEYHSYSTNTIHLYEPAKF